MKMVFLMEIRCLMDNFILMIKSSRMILIFEMSLICLDLFISFNLCGLIRMLVIKKFSMEGS